MKQITRVYMAGRIAKERARFGLVDCTLDDGDPGLTRIEPKPVPFTANIGADEMRFLYTGPFTVGCDHGCAHNRPHAVGGACFGDDKFEHLPGASMDDKLRGLVVRRSITGILNADFVFAWLDRLDAYGTIAELGFAVASGKPVYTAIPTGVDLSELWFVLKMGSSFWADDPREGFIRAAWMYRSRPFRGRPAGDAA